MKKTSTYQAPKSAARALTLTEVDGVVGGAAAAPRPTGGPRPGGTDESNALLASCAFISIPTTFNYEASFSKPAYK